jgi:hypothetical protein
MKELIDFAFSGINYVPTVLLLFVLIYWLIVILGIIDIDSIDIDVDVDMDVDADIDADVGVSGMSSVLAFFNLDQLPLMVFLTFYALPLWMVTLIGNDFLEISSVLAGLMVFVPAAIGCLFIAKVLTIPIALFYKKVKTQTEAVENVIGKVCIAKLPISSDSKSQAEINVNGTSVLLYVKTQPGVTINKGDSALVIEFVENDKYYLVEPY